MFKRLFIGFIILSTIAAEGMMNATGNIYHLLSCLNTGITQSENREMAEEKPAETGVWSGAASGAYRLTQASLIKLRQDPLSRLMGKAGNEILWGQTLEKGLNSSYIVITGGRTSDSTGKAVLDMSDSSPPVL